MAWTIGVDIGGTFTDMVAIHAQSGARVTRKVLTTPRDPLVGVLHALDLFENATGTGIGEAEAFIHATTLATNTLLERKGACAALLTTQGFRDILETGREDRYDLYDLQIDLQSPLVTRDLRLGVPERICANGDVVKALDEVALVALLKGLPPDLEALAICFLHSYANPVHEQAAARIARRVLPSVYVSISSDVAPIIREYERFTATAINAYVGPCVGAYLASLTGSLSARGFEAFIGIMKSDGGMCTPREASHLPARILESGPAAGILSAARTAAQRGEPLAVAFDMGGTTAKACLITHGQPVITDELEVARLARFTRYSGLPLRLPSIDLIEIGAGGGSIAGIGELGLLQVGPESAASEPGPACYARGGDRPTVTDCDLLLGYLNPDFFAGGSIKLDQKASELAIATHILTPTRTEDLVAAAWGIHDLVNENMAREIRLHCVEHGIDPANCTVVATGGAGPVHAAQVLSKLGARRLICPADVGVASAVGLLLAPRTVERTITHVVGLAEVGVHGIREQLQRLRSDLQQTAVDLGENLETSYSLHMRLRGQAYDLRVPVPDLVSEDALRSAFSDEHRKRFGRPPSDGIIEIVNWSVTLSRPNHLPERAPERSTSADRGGTRNAYFGPTHGWLNTPVVSRPQLPSGNLTVGPVLIEEEGSTIVIPPGFSVQHDRWGNVCAEVNGPQGLDTPVASDASRGRFTSRASCRLT